MAKNPTTEEYRQGRYGEGRERYEIRGGVGEADRLASREEAATVEPSGDDARSDKRFKLIAAGTVAAFVAVAVIAAVAAGAVYVIPIALVFGAVVFFVGVHRYLSWTRTKRYGDRARDLAAEKHEDPVPHFGFDEESALGDTAQHADEDAARHADQNRSTGSR